MKTALRQLARQIRLMWNRTPIRRVSYSGKIRYLQLQTEGGQPLNNIEHLEPYGFTSHPFADAEGITLAFNGDTSHTVTMLVADQRYRLVVNEGDVAIYTHHGDKVHIKHEEREIDIDAAVKVNLNAPHTHCAGKLTVAENIEAGGVIQGLDVKTNNGERLGNHDHDESDGGKTFKANVIL